MSVRRVIIVAGCRRIRPDAEQNRRERFAIQRGRRPDHSFYRIYGEIPIVVDTVVRLYGVPERMRVVQICNKNNVVNRCTQIEKTLSGVRSIYFVHFAPVLSFTRYTLRWSCEIYRGCTKCRTSIFVVFFITIFLHESPSGDRKGEGVTR